VNPADTIPVANGATYELNQNESLVVAAPGVLAHVTHAGGAPLAALLVSGPTQGKLTLNSDGSFTYTPNAGYQGTDSFTFKASDGRIDSNVATVTFVVQPVTVHVPLVARDDSATTHQDAPVQIQVLANDGEQNGDTLTIVEVGNPVHGTAIPGAGGAITYIPPAGWLGIDSFTYTISDGRGGTATATVTVTVIPSPEEPEPPAKYEDIHRLHLPLIHR
jgi:large repetitive protein